MTIEFVGGRVVYPVRHYRVMGTLERFPSFNIAPISLLYPIPRRLYYITLFHLQHAKLTIMFGQMIFTLLTVAGFLLGATNALQKVTSPSGILYNCPDIETIEVAYAGSCKSPRLAATVYA